MLSRSLLLSCSWAVLALTPARAVDLEAQHLPMYGGNGGTNFTRGCGTDRVMTGVRYSAGLSIEAIGPLCRPVRADGTLGDEVAVGAMVGGTGGTLASARCGPNAVVQGAYIRYGSYIDGLVFSCHLWLAAERRTVGQQNLLSIGRSVLNSEAKTMCRGDTQPVVKLVGRAAGVVDAIGFVCDEP